jgi:hypothetical protein
MYYSDIRQALKDSFKQVFTCYKDKQTGYEIWLLDGEIIKDWRRNKGLKMIEVSSHSKYITREELLQWEDSLRNDVSH